MTSDKNTDDSSDHDDEFDGSIDETADFDTPDLWTGASTDDSLMDTADSDAVGANREPTSDNPSDADAGIMGHR